MTRHPIVWLVVVILVTLSLPTVMLCVAIGCVVWGIWKVLAAKPTEVRPSQTRHGERR